MELGIVKGNVWATKKADSLRDYKLMIVEVTEKENLKKRIIAADTLDSGIGDTVIISNGSSARAQREDSSIPIDAMIVAVVDKKK